jgi:hypothetical protein
MAEATDMSTNGNSFDPMASWARLSERVENQGKDIIDLRSNMNTGFQGVNANLAALSNELRSNSRTQWPAIWAALSVGVAILTGLGFMALQPIKENTARLEESIIRVSENNQEALAKLSENIVTQKEMEWRTQRGAEDRKRSDDAIADLRTSQVPRQELERVWQSDGQQKAALQKQIDELKQAQANTYSARDLLLDMRERQDRLERQIYGVSRSSTP